MNQTCISLFSFAKISQAQNISYLILPVLCFKKIHHRKKSLYYRFPLFLHNIICSRPEPFPCMASYEEEGLYITIKDLGELQVCVKQYADRTTDVGTYVQKTQEFNGKQPLRGPGGANDGCGGT